MLLFWHFFLHYLYFWAFYAVFLQVRFVVIYALFGVKYFWRNHVCVKKICLFACLGCHRGVLVFYNKVKNILQGCYWSDAGSVVGMF